MIKPNTLYNMDCMEGLKDIPDGCFDLADSDYRGRKKPHRPPAEYIERKRQLSLCSTAELKRELKRRESK